MEEDYIGFDNPVKYLSQNEHCNDNPKRTEPFVGKPSPMTGLAATHSFWLIFRTDYRQTIRPPR